MKLEPLHVDIQPAVAPTGAPQQFRLFPSSSGAPLPRGEYLLDIRHRRGQKHSAQLVLMHDGGDLAFSHGAEIAGECVVGVRLPSGQRGRAGSFYLAGNDLAARLPLRGDLHVHTWYSDGRASPREMVLRAKEIGLDFLAVTDHNCWAGSVEARRAAEDLELPPIVLPGEEVSFARGHIVAVGTRGPVAEQASMPEESGRLAAIAADIGGRALAPFASPEEYMRAVWAARAVHEMAGLAFVAHPFWVADEEYHLERGIANQLLLDGEADGVELLGDVEFEQNLLSIAAYMELLNQGVATTVIANSDTHGAAHTFGRYWTTVFARERNEAGVLEALKAGLAVACVALPGEQLRIYGPLDLVEYSYFLHRTALGPIASAV